MQAHRLLAAIGLLALAGCGSGEGPGLRVSMAEFSFEPAAWTAPAGAAVEVSASNTGTLLHEWVVLQEGIDVAAEADLPRSGTRADPSVVVFELELGPGESRTATMIAPARPGTYQVVCAIPGHLDAGMRGTLTVTADP